MSSRRPCCVTTRPRMGRNPRTRSSSRNGAYRASSPGSFVLKTSVWRESPICIS
ncbi:hypothetical protein ACFFX0_25540 [Citricoccus parietis]|uniref:Uncharacterized protein n=1 Tax=Citricoccus parietis TaxID=592307 RepID=A0ABV5G6X6_9MICC